MLNNKIRKPKTSSRIHMLDNAKGLASIMGVFYHVAMIFSYSWFINIPLSESNAITRFFIDYINVFRMPLFLLIAGYFAMYGVRRKGVIKYTKNKAYRLLLPIVSGLLIILPIQNYIIFFLNKNKFDLMGDIFRIDSLSHLWFLYHVFVFSLVLLSVNLIPIRLLIRFKHLIHLLHRHCSLTIIFYSTLIIVLHGFANYLTKSSGDLNDFINLPKMMINFPIFLFGAFLALEKRYLFYLIFNGSINKILITVFFYLTAFALQQFRNEIEPNMFDYFLIQVMKMSLLIFVLNLMKRFLDFTNSFLTFISDASYGFYILHHPLVFLIGGIYISMNGVEFNFLEYLVVTITTIVATYIIYYYLIHRNKIGRFLLTGSTKKLASKPLFYLGTKEQHNTYLQYGYSRII